MNDFFTFKKLISTTLIKVVYAIGLVIITITGLQMLVKAMQENYTQTSSILLALSIIVIGNLIWRLICEGMIILFSMHENLVEINKKVGSLSENNDKNAKPINTNDI